VIDGTVVDDVAWSYEDPIQESIAIRGLISFEVEHATVTTDLPGQG
jgi:uncharacterized protein (DUF427 family)